jgi:N-acetylneuraminic acid mutarotase
MVYDSADGRVIVFGGWDSTTDFNDTWAYDPAANTWTDLNPGGAKPPVRHESAMAYDADAGKVILFGGMTASTAQELADTWAYDPAANTWTELKPAGAAPAARIDHSMAYDPVARKVILFGGSSHGGRQGDIWAYDATASAWTKLSPTGAAPAARYGCPLVFDSDLGKTLLVGGSDGHFVTMHEIWAYDSAATAWTKLGPTGTVPPGRAHFAMAYDPGSHRMVIFGGEGVTPLADTWAYDRAANVWTKMDLAGGAPAARMYPAMVYAPNTGTMILFGGSDGKTALNDTWSFRTAP